MMGRQRLLWVFAGALGGLVVGALVGGALLPPLTAGWLFTTCRLEHEVAPVPWKPVEFDSSFNSG